MYLVKMRPEQIRDAIDRKLPILMAAGVVEYHGPHLPVGTDLLIAEAICKKTEMRCECVIAPSLPYGTTLSWAGGPEDGEMDFDPEPFFLYVREIFRNLVKMGFQRIYVLQFHQGPDGLQALCIRRAAAEVLRETVKTWGDRWGRKDISTLPDPGIFGRIRIAGPDAFSQLPSREKLPMDFAHAAKGETQFILASDPETVCMNNLEGLDNELSYWLRDAKDADRDEGLRWLEYCAEGWVKELSHRE